MDLSEKMTFSVLKTRSLGSAYLIGDSCSKKGGKVLEIFPIGQGGHLILEHEPTNDFEALFSHFSHDLLNQATIVDCPLEVYKTYLSLESRSVRKHLIFIESHFIGNCFQAAQLLYENGLTLLDLRLMRGGQDHSILVGTGDDLVHIQNILNQLDSTELTIAVIEDAHQGVSSFYNFQSH